MSEPLLTKRLHVSGLTPSITPADLERRLSLFGTVKVMDGFGTRDALGDPRKFGFVTMEIGAKELAKCLNVLSGSMWKGAKLRIGEAKPNFRERLAQFNSQPPKPVRPTRTRVRNHGCPSSTLPLIPLSATAAASTPGWTVTSSGRVVRPMRMRPERPLGPIRSGPNASKAKLNGKVKKRIKPPPARARRRLIDPTKWDSVYLKGVFLDAVLVPSKDALDSSIPEKDDIVDEEHENEMDKDGTSSDASTPPHHGLQLVQGHARTTQSALKSPDVAISPGFHEAPEFTDLRDEANVALAMLGNMFGDKEDWDGRESVDEMENEEEAKGKEMQVDEDEDFEIVPRDFGEGQRSKITKSDKGKGKAKLAVEDEVYVEASPDRGMEMEGNDAPASVEASAQPASRPNLKALFAPKENASFSLVNHLDLELDLDLEADILGISAPPGAPQDNNHPSQPTLSVPQIVEIPTTSSSAKARSRVTLDPSLPLLFPSPDSLPHSHTSSSKPTTTTHRHSCVLFPSTPRVRGFHPLPPSITFTRSPQDTPESIRERWEKDKVSLTHEWKKAWREARGSRRGRAGAGGDIGGGY